MHYRRKLEFLEKSADALFLALESTRLDGMQYAYILQTIINTYEQIRKFRIAERYQKTTFFSDD